MFLQMERMTPRLVRRAVTKPEVLCVQPAVKPGTIMTGETLPSPVQTQATGTSMITWCVGMGVVSCLQSAVSTHALNLLFQNG